MKEERWKKQAKEVSKTFPKNFKTINKNFKINKLKSFKLNPTAPQVPVKNNHY